MKRILFTSITLLVLLIGVLVYLNFNSNDMEETNDQWVTFPDGSTNIPDPQFATFELQGAEESVVVRNFFSDPLTVADPVNDGHYQLGTFIDPASPEPTDEPYYIEYIASTQYFIISLQSEPIAKSRREAEQFLLRHLDVAPVELCKINYKVTVPVRVNLLHAGQSLGFSFCPDAVAL